MSKIATYHITEGELYHYGVKGMKWGVRRRVAAIRTTGKLNRIDRRRANNMSNYIKEDIKSRKYAAKIEKSKSARKVNNLKAKKAAADAKAKGYTANIKKAEAETNKIVKQMSKQGYTVKSKDVVRNTKYGQQFATVYLTGVWGYVGMSMIKDGKAGSNYQTQYRNRKMNQNEWTVKGTKYKFKG